MPPRIVDPIRARGGDGMLFAGDDAIVVDGTVCEIET